MHVRGTKIRANNAGTVVQPWYVLLNERFRPRGYGEFLANSLIPK